MLAALSSGPAPVRIPLVDLGAQHERLRAELDAAIAAVVASGTFVRGPEVEAFEREFAGYCGTQHAVGVGNGTDALRLALAGCGIGPGDDVVTVPTTFAATAEAILQTGAHVHFVDIDNDTWMIDTNRLADGGTEAARAVVAVHLYGYTADMDAIERFARARDAVVVEDAAQAHGAAYRRRRVGALGAAAAFSFYPSKNLGAYGDAGALTTDDPDLAARVREAGDHGRRAKHEHAALGGNSRLDALQAAVLRVKLRHLETSNALRQDVASRYRAQLEDVPDLRFPVPVAGSTPVHHLFVLAAPARDELRSCLAAQGIATGVHYPVPLHLQPAFRSLGYARGDFPVAEALANTILSLPMFPELNTNQIDEVTSAIRDFYAAH